MTDIDYCTGNSCPHKQFCQRHHDYLYRKENGFDTRYAMTPTDDCPQFKLKEYYGQ